LRKKPNPKGEKDVKLWDASGRTDRELIYKLKKKKGIKFKPKGREDPSCCGFGN